MPPPSKYIQISTLPSMVLDTRGAPAKVQDIYSGILRDIAAVAGQIEWMMMEHCTLWHNQQLAEDFLLSSYQQLSYIRPQDAPVKVKKGDKIKIGD
ncbi:hypothetical protein G6011_02579 [Alternaria panax]|uniref:Uncharacterized protein n=1 Tax=Alternaria panax TaxID=48097 RepID=A0AAD4F9V6_9PLEO|nr:hypothetical protein G6011_02579 [Alternaria panax]